MQISREKTIYACRGGGGIARWVGEVSFSGRPLQKVDKFRFLGSGFKINGYVDVDVANKIRVDHWDLL